MAGSEVLLPSTLSVSTTPTDEEVASMQRFIENALHLLIKGNAKSYQYLVQQLTLVPASTITRRKIFRALPRCISTIVREPRAYRALLDVLFKFDFLTSGDPKEVEDYTTFIIHLVSSSTIYVVPTLHMLVRNMCRPQDKELPLQLREENNQAIQSGNINIGESIRTVSIPDAEIVQETKRLSLDEHIQRRFEAVHQTLELVLKLVPTAANVLFPVLCEHFPHKRLDAAAQIAYLRNVLRVTKYVGGLRERVLGLVIDQLVAIDVEIKLDESEEDVFTMDDFLDDDVLPLTDTSRQVDEMADKLDQMMLVMFEHIEQSVASLAPALTPSDTVPVVEASNGTKDVDVRQAALVFKYLLKVFEHSILNTHRSKYPQFLLFYVCRMDPQFQDIFISQLLSTSLDPQTPPTTRQSCAAYLASFLARAKYLSIAYLQKALCRLLKWLHNQMDIYDATNVEQQEDEMSGSAAQRKEQILEKSDKMEKKDERRFQESIYISSLQTVCYMICFRGLEIATSDDGAGYEFLRSLDWERVIVTNNGYCPLAYCQQTVATEFLNLVEAFDLVSEECLERVDQAISTIAASNSKTTKSMERSKKPVAGPVPPSTLLSQRQPLETFFPFDPYLLRRSFRYVGPFYLFWKHADPTSSVNFKLLESVRATIRQMQEDAEDENEGEEEEEELVDEEMGMAGSAPNLSNSYRADTCMGSLSQSCNMSVSSSIDGEGFHDEDRPPVKHTLPSRTTFGPSPALSASSPPSRLPPLGAANAFVLGGFDVDDEDDGF
ncbi:hypothetical protein PsorP6_010713 [Peronosclerospora sorghi]|uniref:Uncharacterized protein n=1 Tax=Peronosclerospora sorghi TaxID=230839 RepID=A0ACC0VX83_9STRA|nr:hypothetical protein PsorP6_010713 [Peronosclerospora sorghi]